MSAPESRPQRVLVVEDEPAISRVCRQALTAQGFEVDIAENGAVAQNMIETKPYDLCLADIRTPVMSGRELYQWLTEKHPELARRVIFATGDAMAADTHGFLEQSGRPFLPKPFALKELRAIIEKTLKKADE